MIVFRRCSVLLFVSVLCMLLMSCGGGGDPAPSPPVTVQTIKWQADGNGFAQFLTNDAQYYQYGFWSTKAQTYETQMSTVTATVKKQSGSLYGGYGIVFCHQDANNFYRLLIDAAGQYSVYARIGGNYIAIIPWTLAPSSHLNKGIGVANVISVVQQSPNSFSVIFNGTEETVFNDGNFTGGTAGFYTGICDQANENFPNTPEDIRFQFNAPVTYP